MLTKVGCAIPYIIAMMMLDKMEEFHMTQKLLAERMGCSQQYVSKILKGKDNTDSGTIYHLPFTKYKLWVLEVYSFDVEAMS